MGQDPTGCPPHPGGDLRLPACGHLTPPLTPTANPRLSELALECVQRAAPSLSLHHVATACSTLLSLGLKPSEQTLGAVVRSVNARLGELPQSRSWDGKVRPSEGGAQKRVCGSPAA